jgi:hypothetical protein
MNKEKNLEWHFDKESGEYDGPNDPMHENFKGNPFSSIVRESLQNSLDAVKNEEKPVTVEYRFFKISRLEKEFPNLFKIEEHIKGGKRFFPKNSQAQKLFNEMLEYLNSKRGDGKKKTKIDCLKISDYNTTGMAYESDESSDEYTNSPFFAFLKAKGVSPKGDTGKGGSFGFGKQAYFGLSAIRTVIVSTITEDNSHFFQGKTRLTTHLGPNGEKLTASGFYDNGNGKPVTNPDQIPDLFKRTKKGTDICVIGIEKKDYWEKMIKSVLNNFWLAIYENKLAVKIKDVEINQDNIDEKINAYFEDEEVESGSINDYEAWSALPYYKAVNHAGDTDDFRIFPGQLDTLGKVKLYIYLKEGLMNRIAYLRKPKMVVYKQTNNKLNGYTGVFICEDESGNQILTEMENPAHSVWSSDNYKSHGGPHPDGIKAQREISDFINRCLDKLDKKNVGGKQDVLGLEEWLSIPENLIGDDELEGENPNLIAGEETDITTDKETGAETTTIDDMKKVEVKVKENKNIKDEQEIDFDEEGELDVGAGKTRGSGGDSKEHGDDKATKGSPGSENAKRILSISYRVIAEWNNSHREHLLLIKSKEKAKNAEIEIKVGTDSNTRKDDNLLRIIEADSGEISDNKIKNINLKKGRNKLRIRFENDLKHSINIRAYAIN